MKLDYELHHSPKENVIYILETPILLCKFENPRELKKWYCIQNLDIIFLEEENQLEMLPSIYLK